MCVIMIIVIILSFAIFLWILSECIWWQSINNLYFGLQFVSLFSFSSLVFFVEENLAITEKKISISVIFLYLSYSLWWSLFIILIYFSHRVWAVVPIFKIVIIFVKTFNFPINFFVFVFFFKKKNLNTQTQTIKHGTVKKNDFKKKTTYFSSVLFDFKLNSKSKFDSTI